jgi:alpha-glucosidase (family GH31 glycosyl hydrolase)
MGMGKKLILVVFLLVVITTNQVFAQIEITSKTKLDTNVVLPPAWAFGIIYGAYTNQEQTVELINDIIEHDYPIDAFWIDSWIWDWKNQGQGPPKYLDFIADTVSYPDMEGMWSFMEEKNIKAGMWMWDAIMQTGNEAEYDDFKSKGFFRAENIRTDGWHNGARTTIIGDNSEPVKGTRCGDIDFGNPEAAAYFQQKVKHFFDKGVDFIKLDKTDAIPVCKAMFEMSQQLGRETGGRGFVLSHSHGVDSDEYKRYPGKWTDDTRSDWNIENPTHEFSPWLPRVAFKENVSMYTDTSRHFHKIPFLANDMGGFSVGTDGLIDEELYIRWLQFAVFVPLTTPFSQPENPTGNIAFKVSPRADSLFRQFAHLKMELFPYIYSYAYQSRLSGVNTIRPINGLSDQYLFGTEMLVAPMVEQGKTSREVYFPENADWINFWSGEKIKGDQTLTVNAPLQKIPLFVKAGAIIPKRKYARSIETGTNDLLELHVYEGADGAFTLIEDDGLSNDYLQGIYASTQISFQSEGEESRIKIEPVKGFYQNMPEVRNWEIIFHSRRDIHKITVNKEKVEPQKFDYGYKFLLSEKNRKKQIEVLFR